MNSFCKVFTGVFFLSLLSFAGLAQNIGINDNGAAPNSNAMLDVDVSTDDKGILIPRLTTAQRTSMALGVADEGLTVYDEDTDAYWLWDGSQWVAFSMGGDDWSLTGNGGTNPPNDFIGTLDGEDFVVKTDNTERMRVLSTGELGVNVTNPSSQISVNGNGNGDWAIYAEGASTNSGASAIRAYQDAASGFGWSYGVLGNITSYGSGYHAGVRGSVVRGSATTSGRGHGVYATAGNLDVNFGLYSHIQGTQEGAAVFGWDKVGGYGDPIPSIASSGNSWAGFFQGDVNVSEKLFTDNFQMSNGATNGYILQSDANGNASWVDQASISDGKNYWADNGTYLSPGNDWGAANPNIYVYQASEVTGIRVDENPGGTGAGNYAILGDNTYESAFGELGSGRQNGVGVYGQADGGNESGVYGYNSGSGYGVQGNVNNNTGFGMHGNNDNASGTGVMGVGNGLAGGSYLTDGSGVSGTSNNVGVAGFGDVAASSGVYGTNSNTGTFGYVGNQDFGVYGDFGTGSAGALGLNNYAGYFWGDGVYFDVPEGAGEDVVIGNAGGLLGDVDISPTGDNQGRVGWNFYWYEMFSNFYTNVSDRSKKKDIHVVDEKIRKHLMKDIEDIEIGFYRYKTEKSEFEKGEEEAYNHLHLGTFTDVAPDYIQDQTFSGIDLYGYTSFALAGVKENHQAIKELKKQLGKTQKGTLEKVNDFGRGTINQKGVWVDYAPSFVETLNGKTPVVTVTPNSQNGILYVKEKTDKGFRVVNSKNTNEEIRFDWVAYAKVERPVQSQDDSDIKQEIDEELLKAIDLPVGKKEKIKTYWEQQRKKAQKHAKRRKENQPQRRTPKRSEKVDKQVEEDKKQ